MGFTRQVFSIPPANRSSSANLTRGHFTTAAEVVASALLFQNSHEDCPQANREAIHERLELSFEQSRSGESHTPEQDRQLLAERRASRD